MKLGLVWDHLRWHDCVWTGQDRRNCWHRKEWRKRWDRCKVGNHRIASKGGYDICAKHHPSGRAALLCAHGPETRCTLPHMWVTNGGPGVVRDY